MDSPIHILPLAPSSSTAFFLLSFHRLASNQASYIDMVSTRSKTTGTDKPKQGKLEEFDISSTSNKKAKASSKPVNSKAKTSKEPIQKQQQQPSRKRKAHQPPTPPPEESKPSDNPVEEGRPRKVPKGSTPSDPVGAARRAAETRRKDGTDGRNGGQTNDRASKAPKQNDADDDGTTQDQPKKQQKRLSKTASNEVKLDPSPESQATTDKPILINRAPVLTLWAACVTNFLHPSLSWPASLSAGAAIATLCAISKGRSIGKVDAKDESSEQEEKKQHDKAKQTSETVEVMSFPLSLNKEQNAVLVSGKPKPQSEKTLVSKFGGEEAYGAVKAAMEEALSTWEGDGDELDGKAFHMYEKFRPTVPSGGKGWGRKGELKVEKIREVVGR